MIASVERLFTAPVQTDPLGVHRAQPDGAGGGDPPDLQPVLATLNDSLVSIRELRRDLTRRMDLLERHLKEISRQLDARAKRAA